MTALDKRADAPRTDDRGWIAEPLRLALMAVLTMSGLFTLAFEVLYLPVYLGTSHLPPAEDTTLVAAPLAAVAASGTFALPVTALLAAGLNVLFIAAMRTLTDSTRVALLPVIVWTFGFLACTFAGPGGDLMLLSDWPTLLLLLCGLIPPLVYVYLRPAPH
ncbi:hypothetical protein APR11_002712 [Nocardia amikacinitolerans]|uniref:hypothetical protein n=1 Tax=Nocardia amikacinitolerans TaxID=756689 RepID=UPI0020A51BF2|nr:hypothetical protein [Nocardia amikacinitolerans]MCP2296284.1 hypothetical protein [Nocardia amikacinitolerans]